MTERGIEVRVSRRVAATPLVGLSDAAGPMDEDLIESAPTWLISVLIAEMPLAENPRCIAGGFQDLGDGGRFEAHPLSLEYRMRDAGAKLMPASHQSATRRRTGRADVEIGE